MHLLLKRSSASLSSPRSSLLPGYGSPGPSDARWSGCLEKRIYLADSRPYITVSVPKNA